MDLSRQELVLGKKQKPLENSKITIVGLGATGSLTAELLTRAGVKNLILIDRDTVEESNLQRQHLFTKKDINQAKATVIEKKLKQINPQIKIKSFFDHLDSSNTEIIKSDLVLDCTDNFQTRFLIDQYCQKNKIPWIFSSAIKKAGYVFNILPGSPRLKDIFTKISGQTCEAVGVLNTITSLISSIQTSEAIKILTKNNPEKDLMYINLEANQMLKIRVKKTNTIYPDEIVKKDLCGGTYIFELKRPYEKLKSKLKGVIDLGQAFKYKEVTVFKNRVLIKANSKKQAQTIYSKYIGN